MTAAAEMTLTELIAEQQRLVDAIAALRVELKALGPYLDTAWQAQIAEDAAKADPRLTQGIG